MSVMLFTGRDCENVFHMDSLALDRGDLPGVRYPHTNYVRPVRPGGTMRSAEEVLKIAVRRFSGIVYATVATCSPDGEPWNSPVYSAHDNLAVYWTSAVDAVHSRNIRANGKAFVVFYDSTVPEGVGQGLYLRCSAVELGHPSEVAKGRAALSSRAGSPHRPPGDFLGTSPRRVYRALPHHAWIDDRKQLGGHRVDARTPVDLEELRRRLPA